MIPIDPLTGEFVAAKLHDHHDVKGDFPRRRWHVWQEPRHRLAVGEREVQLINELSLSDNTVHGRHLQILGP